MPKESILFLPTNFVAAINPTTIPAKRITILSPFTRLVSSMPDNNLTVIPINSMASEISRMVLPIALTLLPPAAFVIYINIMTNALSAATHLNPFANAFSSIPDSILTSNAISNIEIESFNIVFPSSDITLLVLGLITLPIVAMRTMMPTNKPIIPVIAWPALSGSILAIIFITAASNSMPTEREITINAKLA